MDIDKICQGLKYHLAVEKKPTPLDQLLTGLNIMLQYHTATVDDKTAGSGKASSQVCIKDKMLDYPISLETPSLLTKISSFLEENSKHVQD